MFGWIVQTYRYVPALVKRTEYVPDCREEEERNRREPRLVTLWGVVPSRKRHLTVSPLLMRTVAGLKSRSRMVTVRVAAWAVAAKPTAARARAIVVRSMSCLRVAALGGSLALAACGESRPVAPERSGAGLRIGVIGDSYSNGEGVGLAGSWPAQLARRLGATVVVNPSVTGWTSQQALDEELPELARARPQVATVQIGVNDLVQGVAPEAFRANLRRLLGEVERIVGGPTRMLAVTIPDFSRKPAGAGFGDPAAVSAGLRAFNRIVREEAGRRRIAVADVFSASRATRSPSPAAPGATCCADPPPRA